MFRWSVLKYRSLMSERSICSFDTKTNWRTLKSDDVRGTSEVVRLDIEKVCSRHEGVMWLDWKFRMMCRYEGFPDRRVLEVIDRTLYWIRCSILSQ